MIIHTHKSGPANDGGSDAIVYRRRLRRGCCNSLGSDLQNIIRQSYDYLTIMPKLRSTYDGRPIYKTSYEGRKAFLRYDSLAIS